MTVANIRVCTSKCVYVCMFGLHVSLKCSFFVLDCSVAVLHIVFSIFLLLWSIVIMAWVFCIVACIAYYRKTAICFVNFFAYFFVCVDVVCCARCCFPSPFQIYIYSFRSTAQFKSHNLQCFRVLLQLSCMCCPYKFSWSRKYSKNQRKYVQLIRIVS